MPGSAGQLASLTEWALVVALTVLVVPLWRRLAALSRRLAPVPRELPPPHLDRFQRGSRLPFIEVADEAGGPVTVPDGSGRLAIVVVRPGCPACERLCGALRDLPLPDLAGGAAPLLLVEGSAPAIAARLRSDHGLPSALRVLADTGDLTSSHGGPLDAVPRRRLAGRAGGTQSVQ